MIHILLSIKRPFSGKILSGEKTWELRKNVPRLKKGDSVTLWLYESGKDGARAIIGKCRMVSYVRMRHMPFRCIPDDFIEDFCVTGEHLRDYLPCYAWRLQDPVKLPRAVHLSEIGVTRPPQSWQYINEEKAVILEKAASLTSKTCVECEWWSGWDGCCMSYESGHIWDEMPPDHPACGKFKPEETEQGEDDEGS